MFPHDRGTAVFRDSSRRFDEPRRRENRVAGLGLAAVIDFGSRGTGFGLDGLVWGQGDDRAMGPTCGQRDAWRSDFVGGCDCGTPVLRLEAARTQRDENRTPHAASNSREPRCIGEFLFFTRCHFILQSGITDYLIACQ